MTKKLKRWAIDAAITAVAFAICLVVVVSLFRGGVVLIDRVEAAQAATPEPVYSTSCDQVASVGNIDVYQCVDLDGRQFLLNSVGFMLYQQEGE